MTTRTRGRVITLAKLAVSGALLAYLVRKGSVGAVERAITGASPKWLAVGLGLGVLGAVLTIWQWWGVLRSLGLRRTYRRCFRLELAGDVFDAALPSSIGGDVLRAVSVAERSDERQVGVASVVLRRLCNFPGMVLLMGLGIGATWASGRTNRAWPAVLVALAFGLGLVLVTLSPLAGWVSARRWLQRRHLRPLAKVLGTVEVFRVLRGALSAAV
ncbi:MAG: lysylphosphatidylglycerol synthase transmembrane domain-containing protein, partial [Acidimicrobiales bacterium]